MGLLEDRVRFSDYAHILFLHLLNHFAMFTLPILILYFRDDFNLNYTETGILWTSLVVLNTTISILTGFLSDSMTRGRYPLMYVGLVVMIVGWVLILQANTFNQLILIFIFIGIGASAFHPSAFSLITEMFEESKGKALSINMATGMAGNALSPLIFAIIAGLVGSWVKVGYIIVGFFCVSTLSAFIFAYTTGIFNRPDWRIPQNQPSLDEKQSSSKSSRGSSIAFLLTPLILIPLIFTSIRNSFFKTSSLFTSFLYEDLLQLSKQQASVATALVLGFASLFTIVGGTISDRTFPRVSILISSIGTLTAGIGLVVLTSSPSIISFSLFYFGFNAFYYIGSPATSALLADRVAPEQRGKLYGALFSLGQVLSLATPILFGYLTDQFSIQAGFIFILALATVAFFIGLYIYYEEKTRLVVSQVIIPSQTISD